MANTTFLGLLRFERCNTVSKRGNLMYGNVFQNDIAHDILPVSLSTNE